MKLNGSQRLWIVLGALYGIAVTLYVWTSWPDRTAIRTYTVEDRVTGERFEFLWGGVDPSDSTIAWILSIDASRAAVSVEQRPPDLDKDGNPIPAKVYLDENGNPIRHAGAPVAPPADPFAQFATTPEPKSLGGTSRRYLSTDPNAGQPIEAPRYLDRNGNPIPNAPDEVSSVNVSGKGDVYFPSATPKYVMEQELRRFGDGVWPERRSLLLSALAAWAVPLLALYALGAAAGWVIRGFRSV